MQESVVEQLLLSHADVTPGMIVRGTVALVESFGALIQLAVKYMVFTLLKILF
jgi:hypothetical protein